MPSAPTTATRRPRRVDCPTSPRMGIWRLKDAILTVTLDALSEPSLFDEVANLTRREWERTHPGRQKDLQRVARAIDQKRVSIERYLTAFESGKLPEEACGHRVSALQREIVSLETERGRLEAECDLAPSLPTDDLLAELRAALLRASEEQALEKLEQLLACVVDKIVVEGRDHISPTTSCPGFLCRSRCGGEGNTVRTRTLQVRALWVMLKAGPGSREVKFVA